MFSQDLSGNFNQIKVLPVVPTIDGDLEVFMVPMKDGSACTLSGRRVDLPMLASIAMERAAREDFQLMFGQRWSVMRNQWTDRNGKPQEDVIVIMLLDPETAESTEGVPLAQVQRLSDPRVPLSGVAKRVFANANDVRKHVRGIVETFLDSSDVVPHVACV
jgi:hypothetical protein